MFVIRVWVRDFNSPVPYYLRGSEVLPHDRFKTYWTLPGNKIQTFVNEESAQRAFDELVQKKAFLNFHQWDDSDAEIEGVSYMGQPMRVRSYEIQLMDMENHRIPARLSGPG